MKINGNKVEVKLYKGMEVKNKRPDMRDKPKFDRKARAYGGRKKADVYSDYIPNRKKRTKKRH